MTTPQVPDIPGIAKMSPMDMNAVRFNPRHTLLTPQLLDAIAKKKASKIPSGTEGKTS